jgi:hypothetical protein
MLSGSYEDRARGTAGRCVCRCCLKVSDIQILSFQFQNGHFDPRASLIVIFI